MKQTSQRSLLFRQNVNRKKAEWVADSAVKHAKLSDRVGTDPAKRAFYRASRDVNPLNDLGIE